MNDELKAALLAWDSAKAALETAKAAEMAARKTAFAAGFGDEAKEGTNNLDLGEGYTLKGVKKFTYGLKAPEGYKGDKLDAVNEVIDNFEKIGNEGSFVADRLFNWSVTLSVSEYRKLEEEAEKGSGDARAMMKELGKILDIRDAAPTLEIKAPKGK